MKLGKLVLLLSVLTAALALAACGAAPTPAEPPAAPAPEEPKEGGLSEDQARTLADYVLRSDRFLVAPLVDATAISPLSAGAPWSVAGLLGASGLSAQDTETCTSVTGDTADTDEDGIPANATYGFDCELATGQGAITFKGSIAVQDESDSDPSSGYAVNTADYAVSTLINGETLTLGFSLGFKISLREEQYAIAYDYKVNFDYPENSGAVAFKSRYDYTPDDTAKPFAAGTFTFEGAIDLAIGDARFALEAKSEDLHFSSSCRSGFDSGSATYTDIADNRIKLVYNACDNVTVTYNDNVLAGF